MNTSQSQEKNRTGIPPKARLFLLAVTGAGLLVLLHSMQRSLRDADQAWVFLVGLTILTSSLGVKIPLFKDRAGSWTITVSDFFIFTAIMAFTPEAGVIVAASEGLAGSIRKKLKHYYKYLFNIAQLSLAAFLTGSAFHYLKDMAEAKTFQFWLPTAMLCALLYFLLNSMLLGGALSLVGNQPLLALLKGEFLQFSPNNLANAVLASLALLAFQTIDYRLALMAIALLPSIFYARATSRHRSCEASAGQNR